MAVCSFLGHSDIYDADIDTTLQSSIFMSDRELFIFDRLLEGKRPTEAAALVGLSIERSRQVLYHGCKMIRRKIDWRYYKALMEKNQRGMACSYIAGFIEGPDKIKTVIYVLRWKQPLERISMDKEIQLLAPENLPLDLGELGIVIEAELVMPSVYEIALQQQETNFAVQAFIVIKSTSNFSEAVIQYGQAIPGYLDLLLYTENSSGNPCVIIGYELCRYKILHHLPLSESESIRELAAFGAEQYPDYFGHYPVPTLTPWGRTTRHKTITNGLFWLETEQCQRGLAISCPKYDDLSDGARGLAEKFDDGLALPGQQEPGNIFFTESNSSVPLFELLSGIPEEQIVCPINRVALMNAIYQYHPEYVAMYNSAEQAGLNDALGLIMNILGIPTELHGKMDRVIQLCPQSGIEFIVF